MDSHTEHTQPQSATRIAAHEIHVTRLYFVRRNRDAGSIWIDVETV